MSVYLVLQDHLIDIGEPFRAYASKQTESRYIKLLLTGKIIRISAHKSRRKSINTHHYLIHQPDHILSKILLDLLPARG